jgi:hypothetical protein
VSVGNMPVTCRSVENSDERQLFRTANSHTRPEEAAQIKEKQTVKNVI